MRTVIVTGSAGLVGGAAVRRFHELGFQVVGIDNDMRSFYFGTDASTAPARRALMRDLDNYVHIDADIRDSATLDVVFAEHATRLEAVVHCAAQPSHDWAAKDPRLDFEVNAVGTLNLLELTRKYAREASFIFMSTNKVYGDRPNQIPLEEGATRWIPIDERIRSQGIDENLSVDQSTHSIFGVSKTAADLLVQEFGRYFDMNTVCFRGGCLTGPSHAGAELHGFLSYLVKCTVRERPYRIFGYLGKQVRDNIHSDDLAQAFVEYVNHPTPGAVYNIGGGVYANISMLEAITQIEQLSGNTLDWTLQQENRIGDHIWYVSDVQRFMDDYPNWHITRGMESTLDEMVRTEMDAVQAGR